MSTWIEKLARTRLDLEARLGHPPRTVILGIGQELRGDDAAGVEIARRLLELGAEFFTATADSRSEQGSPASNEKVLVIPAGPAPENFTGTLRRFRPELVLLLDAAQMGAAPGEIGWLDPQETGGFSASTHTFPLGILAKYLVEATGCEVILIGIQPFENEVGSPLSAQVNQAVECVVAELIAAFGRR